VGTVGGPGVRSPYVDRMEPEPAASPLVVTAVVTWFRPGPEVLDALQDAAARENTTPEVLRERLEKAGRLDELKADLAQRMAIDLIAEHATPITVDQARARKLIWTPNAAEREAEGSAAGGRLWTPGE